MGIPIEWNPVSSIIIQYHNESSIIMNNSVSREKPWENAAQMNKVRGTRRE